MENPVVIATVRQTGDFGRLQWADGAGVYLGPFYVPAPFRKTFWERFLGKRACSGGRSLDHVARRSVSAPNQYNLRRGVTP